MKKALKIFTLMLCFAGIAAMYSCTKSNEDLIVGNWKYEKKVKADGTVKTDMQGLQVTFNSDGTYLVFGFAGKWSISGDKLTTDTGNDPSVVTIETLNSKELVLLEDDGDREYYSRLK